VKPSLKIHLLLIIIFYLTIPALECGYFNICISHTENQLYYFLIGRFNLELQPFLEKDFGGSSVFYRFKRKEKDLL